MVCSSSVCLIFIFFLLNISGFVSLKTGFLFVYNLVQFLGFSWIFVNMTVRLFIFGQGEKFQQICSLSLSLFSFIYQLLHKKMVRLIINSQNTFISDSLYDTFHTIADVMFFCQILAIVEVLNAAFGVVRTGVTPALIQVWESSLSELQLYGVTDGVLRNKKNVTN